MWVPTTPIEIDGSLSNHSSIMSTFEFNYLFTVFILFWVLSKALARTYRSFTWVQRAAEKSFFKLFCFYLLCTTFYFLGGPSRGIEETEERTYPRSNAIFFNLTSAQIFLLLLEMSATQSPLPFLPSLASIPSLDTTSLHAHEPKGMFSLLFI